MNSFKKSLTAAFVAFSCLAGYAESFYLHVRTPEGYKVLDLETVDRLTFKGGVMTATDANNNQVATFSQSTLESMHVDDSSEAGIQDVVATTGNVFSYDPATRTVTFLADGPLAIYGVDGTEIHTIPAVTKGQQVSLEGIRPGIVILKSGDYSLKTVVR